MRCGLYDTVDHIWYGNDNGPKIFDDIELATLAAEVVDVQLGHTIKRTKAREYDPTRHPRLRDTIKTKMGTKAAIDLLEKGFIQ
jgi:hypothetical protein